jgi:hypothetical protein
MRTSMSDKCEPVRIVRAAIQSHPTQRRRKQPRRKQPRHKQPRHKQPRHKQPRHKQPRHCQPRRCPLLPCPPRRPWKFLPLGRLPTAVIPRSCYPSDYVEPGTSPERSLLKNGTNMRTSFQSATKLHRSVSISTRRPLAWIIGGIVISVSASGCFSAGLSPIQQISAPATQIRPTNPAESPRAVTSPTGATTPSEMTSGLLTPPLPQDMPKIPLSRE